MDGGPIWRLAFPSADRGVHDKSAPFDGWVQNDVPTADRAAASARWGDEIGHGCSVHAMGRHPATGEPTLYAPFGTCIGVQGWRVERSVALLKSLATHCLDEGYRWTHEHRMGELLVFDNALSQRTEHRRTCKRRATPTASAACTASRPRAGRVLPSHRASRREGAREWRGAAADLRCRRTCKLIYTCPSICMPMNVGPHL